MTTTTITGAVTNDTAGRTRRPVLRATVVSGVVAAAVVTAFAAIAHAAGVSFEIDGETIPLAGFAQMTALGAILGGVLAKVLNRRSATPRRRFVQTTSVLTIASCLPSVALPDGVGSKIALVATHVIAAAIVVPALARTAAR